MSDTLFRPRRRPMLRLAALLCAGLVLLSAGYAAIWVRTHVVPPDCADRATLALVRDELVRRFDLPPSVAIENIRTHAGGYFAFRFVCEAFLGGIGAGSLPPGTAIPGAVYYVSRLTADAGHHEVAVSIQPLARLERVQ